MIADDTNENGRKPRTVFQSTKRDAHTLPWTRYNLQRFLKTGLRI